MFENVLVKGIHASRYIMSWVRSGGEFHWHARLGYDEFSDWLKSLPLELNEIEMDIIMDIARNGKLELENSAKTFIKNLKTEE